ncbi:ABC transporter permease [Pseudarthrobacter sp. MEB009]|uniref:ABC transporter permease n=1 Tax=Pseudarthrobacter sp. MEB009 TaxID=3040326 RepID=UPI0025546BAA|nr:ABC transporter permease [Pseudarthrobacter sp. MEB009]
MTQQLLPAGTQVPAALPTDPGIQGTPATPTPAKRKGRGTSPAFVIGSAMLGLVLLLAAVVPLLPGFDPFGQDLSAAMRAPFTDPDHLLGTDSLGRDLLSRLSLASAVTLGIAFAVVILNAVIGTTLGMAAGYFGGRLDSAVTTLADVNLAMPVVLLLIAVAAVTGPSATVTIVTLGLTYWVGYARVSRNLARSLRHRDFVLAPLTQGGGHGWVIRRHILPNVFSQTLIIGATDIATIVLIESSLEYLGLGVQPPVPSWGSMIFEGQKYLGSNPWLAILPGLAMFLTVAGAQFVSQRFTAEGTTGALLRKGRTA